MQIHHIALWTNDLERLKNFYTGYFNALANHKYHNENKQFTSYFIRFEEGAQLEIMQMPGIKDTKKEWTTPSLGLVHFSIALGSRSKVNELTEILRRDGYRIVSEPRQTGDGYYESCILDPDGNRVELME